VTVLLDATALVAWHVEGPGRAVVSGALESDTNWAACAIALTEAVAATSRLTDESVLARLVEDGVRHMWDFLHVVPLDQALLDDAAGLCAEQPIAVSTALHLAAARRLPAPVRFVTFDASQIPVTLALGFEVVSA